MEIAPAEIIVSQYAAVIYRHTPVQSLLPGALYLGVVLLLGGGCVCLARGGGVLRIGEVGCGGGDQSDSDSDLM